jgi:hypothetical protein
MSRRPNRPRRPASQPKIRALRLMGWRYSTTREAWVHRAFSGRVGPVFIDPQYYNHPGVTETVQFDANRPFRPLVVSLSAEDRPPLPQRAKAEPARRDRTKIKVQLSEADDARVVVVDGKPPRRGVDPDDLRTAGAVVVPIKSARATG